MTPAPSSEQYSLFRAYIDARHADGGMAEMSVLDYSLMVEDSVVETFVTEYRLKPDPEGDGSSPLIGVSLCDRLSDGVSMVYSFYDPDMPQRSLGTYMILDHVEFAPQPGAPVRLSRLLDRGLAQDALQEPLRAPGAPHFQGLGPHRSLKPASPIRHGRACLGHPRFRS